MIGIIYLLGSIMSMLVVSSALAEPIHGSAKEGNFAQVKQLFESSTSNRLVAEVDNETILDDSLRELLVNAKKVIEYRRRYLELDTRIKQITGDSAGEFNLKVDLNGEMEKAELSAQLELLNISYGLEKAADSLLEELSVSQASDVETLPSEIYRFNQLLKNKNGELRAIDDQINKLNQNSNTHKKKLGVLHKYHKKGNKIYSKNERGHLLDEQPYDGQTEIKKIKNQIMTFADRRKNLIKRREQKAFEIAFVKGQAFNLFWDEKLHTQFHQQLAVVTRGNFPFVKDILMAKIKLAELRIGTKDAELRQIALAEKIIKIRDKYNDLVAERFYIFQLKHLDEIRRKRSKDAQGIQFDLDLNHTDDLVDLFSSQITSEITRLENDKDGFNEGEGKLRNAVIRLKQWQRNNPDRLMTLAQLKTMITDEQLLERIVPIITDGMDLVWVDTFVSRIKDLLGFEPPLVVSGNSDLFFNYLRARVFPRIHKDYTIMETSLYEKVSKLGEDLYLKRKAALDGN